MFIFVCAAENNEPDNNFGSRERRDGKKVVLRKLTEEENEKRLEECGKPPINKPNKYDNMWFGTYGRFGDLWQSFGVVLISEYHAITSKDFIDFEECKETVKVQTQTYANNRYVKFSKTGEPNGNYTAVKIKQVTEIGPCEKGKRPSEAIQIFEFEKKVDWPYACVLSDESEFVTPSDKLIFPTSYRGHKDGPYHEKQKGILKKQDGKLVWDPENKNFVLPANKSGDEFSIPLLIENERTTVVAVTDRYDYTKKNFKVTLLQPFLRELCSSFGICPGPSTTTTITTTTTTTPTTTTTATTTTTTTETTEAATTEPPTTTTTYYVPEILGDPEMMDFEMPFDGPLVKRWGSGAQSLNYFVVFVVSICLVMG
ncbi:unnamed protein product [Caenorhabditis brenneri]